MSVEFRAIKESEREECLDLWCAVWSEDRRPGFRRYFYGDVEWLPYYTQVAVVDGKLVSAVTICKRVVACGDFRLTMGSINNVATLPEYRGRHYNTECLKRAIAVMEADAMDFSLLFTGIHDYYARLGYAPLPARRMIGAIRPDFTPRATAYNVRAATEGDLPAIRAIYDIYNQQRPLAVQRYEAYWRDWLGIAPDNIPDSLLVAARPGEAASGYILYRLHDDHVSVEEFGTRGATPEAEAELAVALLDAVAARGLAAGQTALRLHQAYTSEVLQATQGIFETIDWREATSGMARVLHRENLLRSFTMELNERWITAGRPKGSLTFQTPYGPARLSAEGAFLRVEPTDDATGALSQSALLGLLFGSLPPEQAAENAASHPLLRALFPSRAVVWWRAD